MADPASVTHLSILTRWRGSFTKYFCNQK